MRKLLQQALDVIIELYNDRSSVCGANQLLFNEADKVISALEAELAKPEQEPVNTMPTKIVGPNLEQILNAAGFYKREWVGLTELEINHYNSRLSGSGVAEEIQAKLRERNT
jgi:hypothetical protein